MCSMNANLSAPGKTFAGSWEDPSCEVRGQFLGHWLSGTAMLGKHSGKTLLNVIHLHAQANVFAISLNAL